MASKVVSKYPEYRRFVAPETEKSVLAFWRRERCFERSVSERSGKPTWVFYEGPPSANGKPGIHHVISRTLKDLFCRYHTMKGFQVKRRAGWDTHGLPVELGVEKQMGITKDDIGKTISVQDFNRACRDNVMQFTAIWNDLTEKMGYWVDLDNPYVTYDNKYIESVWALLRRLYDKDLLYRDYTIQPFSPKAGTGLSSHELNQPGCYRPVKDITAIVQFELRSFGRAALPTGAPIYALAWTTTPWTLPSNTALAVNGEVDYLVVELLHPYTNQPVRVLLAEARLEAVCGGVGDDNKLQPKVIWKGKGAELEGATYKQLLPYAQPTHGKAFEVVLGDFVTTTDGTGIVHIAPSFGADDFAVAKRYGIGALTLVDKQGRFVSEVTDFAGEYVKEQYYGATSPPHDKPIDLRIALKLKDAGLAFKVEKYEHDYPHCWRTDTPIIYYPLEAWFIRTTAAKERLMALNDTIRWKPEGIGKRFSNWLENLVDWNLSRSRFWGIPLPVWSTADGTERICVGSVEELKSLIQASIKAGVMKSDPLASYKQGDMSAANYAAFDLHRPFIDDVVLVSPSGKPMQREREVIDVWFDSGAMPYAQVHYPFENRELIEQRKEYPADFIAEGSDQTRGWFFTLHAIGTLLFDSVAYKSVISNGLVLDKKGQKMSKRLGNVVDPFALIEKYGADAVRWYMISNAQPWDNLKFDEEGLVQHGAGFFNTLFNSYSFFAVYANVDKFDASAAELPLEKRSLLDRWILSRLQTVIAESRALMDDYEPMKAARAIADFVDEDLSRWYIRQSRRRFWKSSEPQDKLAAYQTLRRCLSVACQLIAPIAPFLSDQIYRDLTGETSVHLSLLPDPDRSMLNPELERMMATAKDIVSAALSIRTESGMKVRQPLAVLRVGTPDAGLQALLEPVRETILRELNVKELRFSGQSDSLVKKSLKPNFKALGPKLGARIKSAKEVLGALSGSVITELEQRGMVSVTIEGAPFELLRSDVEIVTSDLGSWKSKQVGAMVVALDCELTEALISEGLAREFVNRVQNQRKKIGLEVTDRISITVSAGAFQAELSRHEEYIGDETLAQQIVFVTSAPSGAERFELDEKTAVDVLIRKID